MIGTKKADSEAFIFTLKNPHGVYPMRFLKRKEIKEVIQCSRFSGPLFCNGQTRGSDICIGQICNQKKSCFIGNDGNQGYECHPQYKKSLFVDTAGPNQTNWFSVLDYEVHTRL